MSQTQIHTNLGSFETVFRSVIAEAGTQNEADRRKALDAYQAAGFPSHKDEEFKYVSFRTWQESALTLAPAEQQLTVSLPNWHGAVYVFINGRYSPAHSKPLTTTGRIRVDSSRNFELNLSTASYEGKLGSTNDSRFLDLNSALETDGISILIPDGTVAAEPIQFVFIHEPSSTGEVVTVRNRISIGQNSIVKFTETYLGGGEAGFTNAVTEIEVGADSNVEHVRVQDESLSQAHVGQVWVHQERNSTYSSTNVQFGAALGRCDLNVFVNGEHAETWLNGVYVGKGDQQLDNHTRIDHAVPNCHSYEVYKGILSDESAGVFNGKIFVYEDAQKTDAKQTNQALLLSGRASVNTKPQLEIFADDVKCTHGATVGQLRDDAMFYLRSRGIPVSEARNLLVYAFAAEAFERVSESTLHQWLEARLYEMLS